MAFSFLSPDTILDSYKDAKTYTESLTEPFHEFERIARNRPHAGIDKAYPKTTDGTTASIIRKTPHRIVQQLPTGNVISDKNDWLTIVAGFIYTNKIIPYANDEYALIQKCWNIIEKSLTFGFAATYTPFVQHNGTFSADLTIPYWGDIMLQPGKKSDANSNYIFMRSWWRKEDIEALIASETKLSKKKSYKSTWDLKALNKIKNLSSAKDAKAMTPAEREKGVLKNSGVEFVTGFQRGVGAKFITFNPGVSENSDGVTILRTKENKDPRGEMPISFMYGDIDGSNPLGRGIVELVGGLQNLIDGDMQMYQYNRALMLAPPVIKRGGFNKNRVKYAPNVVIDVGSEPNATVEPIKIDTTAIANYPALYGLQKSQLLNLLASPDTSISSDIGNPGFSKTPQGVQAQQANISVDDNYVRKQFESWFEKWSETAINLYFAERTGIEELQLDQPTSAKLRDLPNFDATLLSEDNKIRIDYSTETPVLQFRVNPATSKMQNDQIQFQSITGLLDTVMKYPMLNAAWGGAIDVDELARRLVVVSAVENPEQIAPEPTEEQKQAKEESKNKPNGFSPMFDKPSIRMNYPDLPPAAQVQLLANAGLQVTIDDVMAGPVVDPNIRGVTNPIDDPNILVPGGGPATQSTPGQLPGGPANPLQQDGVNLTPQEIQRISQDPRFAQQGPPQQPTQPPIDPSQPQIPSVAQSAQAPQMPQDPNQPNQHQDLIDALKQVGASDTQIQQALAMLEQGYSEQEILTMLVGGQS